MTLSASQYRQILDWCNRVRAKIDAPPVDELHKGKCQDAGRCALAETINHKVPRRQRVNVDEMDVYRGDDAFEPDEVIAKTPEYIERFIREFDRKTHPELVGRGWAARD